MLTARNIMKRFGAGQGGYALSGVDLTIERQEFVAITGRSGSGKSTLLNVLSTLMRPDSGQLVYQGRDLAALAEKELNALRSSAFSMVFQMRHLLPYLTALENVLAPFMKSLSPVGAKQKTHAGGLLKRVGLAGKENRLPGELSGGEQQRVAIARALATAPSVLFADEPTGSLDQATGEEIMGLFRELHEDGLTVIMVTHDPAHAAIAGRKIELRDGLIISKS